MGEVLAAILAGFALALGIAALFAVLQILYPRSVADARSLYEIAPRRCFWIGVVNFILFSVLFLVTIAIRDETGEDFFNLIALIVALPPLLGSLYGLAGISKMVGERLFPSRNERDHIAGGAATLTIACLVPFIGWFGLFPLLTTAGLGASVLALLQRRRRSAKGD